MADGHRVYPVDILVLHHAVSDPMDNWDDIQVQDWFSNIGKSRGYNNGAINPQHYHPSRAGQLTYSMAHFCLHPYTKDGNKYGWRLTQLIDDVWNNVAWHAGNWAINQRSIGIEVAGNWLGKDLPEKASMLIADTFRQHDLNINGKFQVTGHQQWSATQCPGGIMNNRPQIIDMINNPQKYSGLFGVEIDQAKMDEANKKIQNLEGQVVNLQTLKTASDEQIKLLNEEKRIWTEEKKQLDNELTTQKEEVAKLSKEVSRLTDEVQKVLAINEGLRKDLAERDVKIHGLEQAIQEYKTGKESDTYMMTHATAQKLEKILVSKESWKAKATHLGREILLVLLNWGTPTLIVLLAMFEGWFKGLNETTVIGGFTLGAGASIVKVLGQTLASKGTVLVKAKADEEKAKIEEQLKAIQ